MKITNPITLDVARSNSYICLLAKQFDSNSRYLEITLADNGQPLTIPADASAVLRATRADGTGAVVSGTVANGKATVEIDDYILEVNGAVTLSLEISKDGETLTTPSCNLTIQKADANGWIRVYVADANKVAGNYYITIGGVSYSFTTSQAIPAGGSVYFSSNNATAETRDATGTVIETGLVLTEGTTGTQLVTDVPTMSFLATIAGRVAALESEMPNKADKDGIIALAENLTPYSSTSGATQSVPFINQGTGCGNGESIVDTGSYAQVKKKLGNTVGVNQLVKNGTFSTGDTTNWSTVGTSTRTVSSGVLTMQTSAVSAVYQNVTLVKGHRYILCATLSATSDASVAFGVYKNGSAWYATNITADGAKHIVYRNIDASSIADTDTFDVRIRHNDTNSATITIEKVWLVDLAIWFGSNDRIPAHLLSHPENWGRYYSGSLAYNPGQLVNADGTVMRSIGRNCFDKSQTMVNAIVGTDGSYTTNANAKSIWMPCIPNTEYHFFKSKGARFNAGSAPTQITSGNFSAYGTSTSNNSFTITTGASDRYILVWFYNSAIDTGLTADEVAATVCVSLYYPGESGYDQYYPYSVLAEVDTGSEVLYGDGTPEHSDEKLPSGQITRRRARVDLGTLTYNGENGSGRTYSTATPSEAPKVYGDGSTRFAVVCSKYAGLTRAEWWVATIGVTICGNGYGSDGKIGVADPAFIGKTPDEIKALLSGVYLEYDVTTPTTEQGTAFSGASADNFAIDDFGSMYWTQTNGVPQGVEVFYPYDYKAAVDTILNEVNGDVTKLVTAEKVPDAPSSNGTYVLKVTVSGGTPTYSWVAE